MMLILDNNEYRRHDLCLDLEDRGIIVAERTIKEANDYVKPAITVYINPSTEEINKIRNDNTLTIIVKRNTALKLPCWMKILPFDKSLRDNLAEIAYAKFGKKEDRRFYGVVLFHNRTFVIGGAKIFLSKREREIARFFLINGGKKFYSFDVCDYIYFRVNPEENFEKSVRKINAKCRRLNREPLILLKGCKYSLNKYLTE